MIEVGLIGYGKWGKILYSKLIKLCDVKFVCKSNDEYESKLNDVDWVVVATPNETHFNIVRNCISAGKNVFCEKPLTLTEEQSKLLFNYAEMKGVKLYVDDVQNWREAQWDLMENNLIERKKKSNPGSVKDLLYRLTYHDIYYLWRDIKNSEIENIIPIDLDNKLQFKINFNDVTVEFCYDINYEDDRIHHINGVSLMGDETDDPLQDMLEEVLNENVDFGCNKEMTLFTNKIIDKIDKKLFKKIAVVGGGIFGCTIAWLLSKNGFNVNLFEKNNDIFTSASSINQYRLHRGYHYPRSEETAVSSREGEKSFLNVYGNAVYNGGIEHYYCIAKNNSLVTSSEYIKFMNDNNLNYEELDLDILVDKNIALTVKIDEHLFNPNILKSICWDKLNKYNVNTKFNMDVDIDDLKEYDYVINATYANLNKLLPLNQHRDYQFELCEKPVVKLPHKYKNKSIVIMDGPFMCIDPLKGTKYHVMGNVVHAIHRTNIGKFPICESKFQELLNNGIVENPIITNIDKFINAAKEFFIDIEKAEHIGSMFTFRTVLPDMEKDDARPTLIRREDIDMRIFTLFSGKIGTCVDAAKNVIKTINND